MPWTESRSREAWLAEVKRRGERMKRRRRGVRAAAGVALLAPALAFASLASNGDGERQLQVAAGGPTSTAGAASPGPAYGAGASELVPTTTAMAGAALPEVTAPTAPVFSTSTSEVHRRVDSINGIVAPDDPTVRPAPTSTAATGADPVSHSPALAPPPSSTTVAPAPLAACPAADVTVTVTPENPSYAPHETVRWSSTLENRSSTPCLVSGRAFFRVEDAAGKTVGSFAYTANYMLPVKAEPGKTITDSGSWDQRDCSGQPCAQVPPGTYVVVAEWTEAGPYVGRGSFEVAG